MVWCKEIPMSVLLFCRVTPNFKQLTAASTIQWQVLDDSSRPYPRRVGIFNWHRELYQIKQITDLISQDSANDN